YGGPDCADVDECQTSPGICGVDGACHNLPGTYECECDNGAVPGPGPSCVGYVEVAVGSRHACGISAGGDLYCWGNDDLGQLGTGPDRESRAVPTRVGDASDWHGLSTSDRHTCALRGGDLYCWGYNSDSQLGVVDPSSNASPTLVSAG
ncbi:MAG TPA: hypothetical protein PK095_17395, partial [Myxococcota bacterium]|nr:hypothetical protein [Myxococcota bacterium]